MFVNERGISSLLQLDGKKKLGSYEIKAVRVTKLNQPTGSTRTNRTQHEPQVLLWRKDAGGCGL